MADPQDEYPQEELPWVFCPPDCQIKIAHVHVLVKPDEPAEPED